MKLLVALLLFAPGSLHFEVTDARGKSANVTLEASAPDASGWSHIQIAKSKAKSEPVLIWPMEAMAAPPDGPEPIPAIVIQKGDTKALDNPRVAAAIACPVVLGIETLDDAARSTGLDPSALGKAISAFYSGPDATTEIATALRERQRQLTRIPSEIYPYAMLYGQALTKAGKFDLAAVAFDTALKQRPGDARASTARNDALVKAGKSEAVH